MHELYKGSSELATEITHGVSLLYTFTHLSLAQQSLITHSAGEQLLGLSDHLVKGDARARHVATDVTIVILKV